MLANVIKKKNIFLVAFAFVLENIPLKYAFSTLSEKRKTIRTPHNTHNFLYIDHVFIGKLTLFTM